MNWTVDLTVSFIPCPPEQAPAWRRAMLALNNSARLQELAMNVNADQRGRTAGGQTTYRPLIQLDEDDYPPDSQYWHSCAMGAAGRLCERMGYEDYSAWLDGQEEPAHWRALYDLLREKEQELESSLSEHSIFTGVEDERT